MAKKKIAKLTDEQYFKYIMSLKDEPAPHGTDKKTPATDGFDEADEKRKE